jgi:hypothetical protein
MANSRVRVKRQIGTQWNATPLQIIHHFAATEAVRELCPLTILSAVADRRPVWAEIDYSEWRLGVSEGDTHTFSDGVFADRE